LTARAFAIRSLSVLNSSARSDSRIAVSVAIGKT